MMLLYIGNFFLIGEGAHERTTNCALPRQGESELQLSRAPWPGLRDRFRGWRWSVRPGPSGVPNAYRREGTGAQPTVAWLGESCYVLQMNAYAVPGGVLGGRWLVLMLACMLAGDGGGELA